MSYSRPYQLGVIDASALLKTSQIADAIRTGVATADTSVIQPASPGLRMAPKPVQDAVTIQVPAHCGAVNKLVEGIQFPATGPYLEHGNLYVVAFPLLKKLNAAQQASVEQEFWNRMNPAAAKYPVNTTTPCDLGARKADACACRDRKNPLTWLLHKPGNIGDSMEVQKCLGSTADKLRARSWISFYHQLWGSQDLPSGYREFNGSPAFVYTIALNPDPKVNVLNEDGSVRSGNIDAKPPQMPKLRRQKVYAMAYSSLGKAMESIGLRRTDVAPSAILTIDRWDATALTQAVDELTKAIGDATRQIGGGSAPAGGEPAPRVPSPSEVSSTLRWNRDRYFEGQRNKASKIDKQYTQVVNLAIEQAAAYGRDSVMAIWGTIAGIFVTGLTARVTDAYARQAQMANDKAIRVFGQGILAIQSSQTVLDNLSALAPQLLENPDPQAAYAVLKELKKAFNESIGQIQAAQSALPQAPQLVATLFDRVQRTGGEIEKGLEEAKTKLSQRAPGLDPELKRRFECKLYAKARNEQQVWPRRLLDQLPPLQGAIQAYASLHPQADAAIGRYQQAIAMADEIESQLNLPWWAKDLGPLPVWGWGAIGLTAFFGGAVYLRTKRKKVKPNKSMKDLAPVAYQIARTENYNDQAVARALRAELGDDAAKAAQFAGIAAKGGAEANFWRDVQTLLKLGYNRKRRRRTSRRAA